MYYKGQMGGREREKRVRKRDRERNESSLAGRKAPSAG